MVSAFCNPCQIRTSSDCDRGVAAWEKRRAACLAEVEWKEKSAGGRNGAGGGPAILTGTRDQFRKRIPELTQAQGRPAQLILDQATGWLVCLLGLRPLGGVPTAEKEKKWGTFGDQLL